MSRSRAGSLSLLAPVPAPGKVVCVGLNYRDHAAETGKPIPTEPVLFAKFANSVVGDGVTGSRSRPPPPRRTGRPSSVW